MSKLKSLLAIVSKTTILGQMVREKKTRSFGTCVGAVDEPELHGVDVSCLENLTE